METFRYHSSLYEHEPRLAFYVRSCGHFQLVPPDRESYRRNVEFCEIFWCISGKGGFRSGSTKETLLKPDWVWYYPAGATHDYQPRGGFFHYRWLSISGPGASSLFSGLDIHPGLNYGGACPHHLFSLVELNLKPVSSRQIRMRALAAAFQILTQISPGQHPSVHGSMVEEARSLIDDGFADSQFNVEKAASLLGVHRGSLSRAFSQAYGIAVSQYISQCRVRHAIVLLKTTSLPIREIALKSGFSSHEYFSRVFLEHTGITPATFRAQADKGLY